MTLQGCRCVAWWMGTNGDFNHLLQSLLVISQFGINKVHVSVCLPFCPG